MRFMIMVKASQDTEAGEREAYHEELAKAACALRWG